MPCSTNFSVATSDFLKQMIILKSFNSVFFQDFLFVILDNECPPKSGLIIKKKAGGGEQILFHLEVLNGHVFRVLIGPENTNYDIGRIIQ